MDVSNVPLNDEERQQELPEDNGHPVEPAVNVTPSGQQAVPASHPSQDSSQDATEVYQEGSNATIETPNDSTGVVDYHPPEP